MNICPGVGSLDHACMLICLSYVRFCVTLWTTVVHQAPLSMCFSRQKYWSGLPGLLPGGLSYSRIESASLMSPVLTSRFFIMNTAWKALAEPYGNSIFSLVRNLHAVLRRSCGNLHSHPQCRRVLFSPHPLQHLLFVDFLMVTILNSVRWYLSVVWFVFLSNVEQLLMCLLAIWITFLE